MSANLSIAKGNGLIYKQLNTIGLARVCDGGDIETTDYSEVLPWGYRLAGGVEYNGQGIGLGLVHRDGISLLDMATAQVFHGKKNCTMLPLVNGVAVDPHCYTVQGDRMLGVIDTRTSGQLARGQAGLAHVEGLASVGDRSFSAACPRLRSGGCTNIITYMIADGRMADVPPVPVPGISGHNGHEVSLYAIDAGAGLVWISVTDGITVVALLIDPKTGATIRQVTCVIVESSRVASVHLSRSSDGERCYVDVRLGSRSAYSYPLPPSSAPADADAATMEHVMPMQSSTLGLLRDTVAVWGANDDTRSHGMILVRSNSGKERLVHTWAQ